MATADVSAHGFGQRYDLPLPLSLYLFGTAAAIVFSFVVVGLFVRHPPRKRDYPHINLRAGRFGRLITHPVLALALKLTSFVLFIVTLIAGLWGNQNPYQNIAPTLVWIIGWVGLAYVSAFIGNVWVLVNPWRTVFDGVAAIYRLVSRGRELASRREYPERVGVWPAFVLLLAFSWIELVYPSPAVPAHIAWLVVGYSAITWIGMTMYGAEVWLRYGEVFSVVFGIFARFAPTEIRVRAPAVCKRCPLHCRDTLGECINCYDCYRHAEPRERELMLRPFAAGLLDDRPVSASMTALVLLILSTVLYDGILATPEWGELENSLVALVPGLGDVASIAVRTFGLAAFWLLFFGAYLGVSAIISAMVPGGRLTLSIAQTFALTLVPIAIAYHLAHYLTYLLIQGQYIIPLLSDPFGYGWDLVGTAAHRVDISIVGARFAWYTAVTAIVLGHIAAVYLAHIRAMRVFDQRQIALGSQVPLTMLMVVYTFVSLSILAEPITERRPSAQPTATAAAAVGVPEAAILPEPGTGRLRRVGPDKVARQKLAYRMLGSAFQDGTRMAPADLLYAYVFAYRWGVRSEGAEASYDPAIDAATASLRQHLVGLRFTGTDTTSKSFRVGDTTIVRELFLVDVFTTSPPEDPEQDAIVAPPWTNVPWHLLVLMEEAVGRGWAAFSQGEAARRGVEWLDLARSKQMNERLASLVATFERDGYRPDALASLVSVDEARKRWTSLAAFYDAHHHFLVTNGPYQLKQWSAESAELEVFRDLSFPLGVGSYDAYAIPRRAYVTKVELENYRLRLFADIETINKFQRSYEIVREPLRSVAPDVLKRAAPLCRYMVVDAKGKALLAGDAPPADDRTFQVDLKGKLSAGRYDVFAEVMVNENAMNAIIQRIPLVIPSGW
ncbi:MAG TPA: hypothetical protein VEN29_15135 [Casimicrobiaceae bacterium]|nr:hypothetical protein [Casimicrobiaceae bacterium]